MGLVEARRMHVCTFEARGKVAVGIFGYVECFLHWSFVLR